MLIGTRSISSDAFREALEATARFRNVDLRLLEEAANGLATLRSTIYLAYRRSLGVGAEDLPESYQLAIDGVVAFVDPVIAGHAVAAVWDPIKRGWQSRG